MTIASSINKIIYSYSKNNTEYHFNFKILSPEHLSVIVRANNQSINLIFKEDYTVEKITESGGMINITSVGIKKIDSSAKLIIKRKMPFVQEISYQNFGLFPAKTHEQALDLLTMQDLELKEILSRAVLAPEDQTKPLTYNDFLILEAKLEDKLQDTKQLGSKLEKQLNEAFNLSQKIELKFKEAIKLTDDLDKRINTNETHTINLEKILADSKNLEQKFKNNLNETTDLSTKLSNELTQLKKLELIFKENIQFSENYNKKLENSFKALNLSIEDIDTKVTKATKIENDIQSIYEKIILIAKSIEQGIPIASSQNIGGIIVGDGLKSDSNGKLSFLNNFYTNDVNFYISATGDDSNSGLSPENAKKTLSSFNSWLNRSNFNNFKVTLNLSGNFEDYLEIKGMHTCSEINIKGKAKITSYDHSAIYIQSVLSTVNISNLTLNVLDNSTKKDSTNYSCIQIVDSNKVTFDDVIKIKGGKYGVYISNSQVIQNNTNKLHITNSSFSCLAADRKAYIEFLGNIKSIGTSKFFIYLDIASIANFKPGSYIDGSLFEGQKCLLNTNALLNTYSQAQSFLPGNNADIKSGAKIA